MYITDNQILLLSNKSNYQSDHDFIFLIKKVIYFLNELNQNTFV